MIQNKIATLDWTGIANALHTKGYCIVPKLLSPKQCKALIALYEQPSLFRKQVIMAQHRFGKGAYKYFDYPLPETVADLRRTLYPKLSGIANGWMKALKIAKVYPDSLWELQQKCAENGQNKPTPLLLKYEKGGFNTLHQDIYGTVYFPMQALFLLTEPETDFTGGEFVITQQIPRAQSKAIVLQPKKGDMIVFATNYRPIKGTRGYYRAKMRHGVSEVHSGKRRALGIIFHDAAS
ncbi:MAG: 2OG-Fe(II) oxygenase [Bacteroidota bacterium]